MEDLSNLAEGSLSQMGSMGASNTVSAKPLFGAAPGSRSESVLDSDVRPEADPVPPVAPANVAGPGDRGGLVVGEGTAPGAGRAWDTVDSQSSPAWTGTTAPSSEAGH